MSTDVGTWTNWLTFEPEPDYSPDAGTGLLSPLSYKLSYADDARYKSTYFTFLKLFLTSALRI